MTDNQPAPTSRGAKTYEMLWDCRFCGSKKLLGKTHRYCPNCGAQQDPNWRYFPSDAEKVAVQDHVYVGADRICPACSTLNSAVAEFCGNCGSPLTKAAQAKSGESRERGSGETFETEDLKQKQQAAAMPQAAAVPKASAGSNKKWIIALVLIAVIVGGAIFALTRTTSGSAYVTGHHWERSIEILSLQPVPGKSSCESVPLGAYGIQERYEQVGSRQVPDGEQCRTVQINQGDGTFREEERCQTTYRSEPVYGYVCYYVLNTWLPSRSVNAQGDKASAPRWPDTNITSSAACLLPGCEREGGRSEKYVLEFKGDGDRTFECPVDFSLWQSTNVEKAFTIEIGSILKDFRCNTLKPVS